MSPHERAAAIDTPGPVLPGASQVVWVGTAGAAVASLLLAVAVLFDVGLTEGLLCAMGSAALVAAALPMWLRSDVDLFEPVPWVVLIVAIGVTGKCLYVALGPEERVGSFVLLGRDPGDLLYGSLLVTVGLVCLALGYMMRGFRWNVATWPLVGAQPWDSKRLAVVVFCLVGIALISSVLFASSVDLSLHGISDLSSKRWGNPFGIRGFQGFQRWGGMLVQVAFYLVLAVFAASNRRFVSRAGLALAGLGVLAVAFPFFVSSRQGVLLFIIRSVIIFAAVRRELKWRSVVVAVAVGLVLLMGMTALRHGADDASQLAGFFRLSSVIDETVGGRQFLDVAKTAHVVNAVPDTVEYQHGRTLIVWVVAPVPRSLWPGKPQLGVGAELGPAVFGTEPGGVPPGIVAELYLNFGLPGVLVGMFTIGLLLKSLSTTWRPLIPNTAAVLIYTLLMTRITLSTLTGSFSMSMVRLLQEIVPLVAAISLVRRRS